MQQWEYGSVVIWSGSGEYVATFYRIDQHRTVDLKRDRARGDRDDRDQARRFVAALGLAGWEMVGVGETPNSTLLYFKRPVPA